MVMAPPANLLHAPKIYNTVAPGNINEWGYDCFFLIGVLYKTFGRNMVTPALSTKFVGNSIGRVQHGVCIISAIAIAMLVSTELETAVVQASLLLRCGDVERNPGPMKKEGEMLLYFS